MASPIIWANSKFGKLLLSVGLMAKNGYQTLFIDVDPRTTATDANRGDTLLSKYGIFQKDDSGSTTNWTRYADQQLYKVYDNFESNNGNGFTDPKWIAYGNTNSALNYPDDFGGTAGPTAGTTTSNTDLSGNFVLRLGVSSSMNGKGTYRAFSISNGEKGLPFIFETQVKITKLGSAEWASNAQFWVVGSNDNFVSNFQNIPLTNYVVSKSGLLKGSFIDSSSTLTNFRLCIHFSGLTDTFNVDFDEVKIYQSNADTLSPNSKKVVSSWGYKSGMTMGAGSTNTKILYLTSPNIIEQGGSLFDYFTYNQSTSLGDSFVAKSSFYLRASIGCDTTGSGDALIGLSINSNELSSQYVTINDNNKITTATSYTDIGGGSGARLINKGDIVRIHFDLVPSANGYFKLIFEIDENTGSNVIASSENFMPIKVAIPSQSVGAGATEIDLTPNGDTRFTTNKRFKLPPNGRYLITLTYLHSAFPQWINFDIRKSGVTIPSPMDNYRDFPSNLTNYNQGMAIIDTSGWSDSDYASVWIGGQSSVTVSGNMQIDRLDKPFSMNLFQAAGMVLSPTDNVLPAQFSRSTTQSMTNATNNQIVWDTVNYNPSNAIQMNTTTGRVTNYGTAGYYKFVGRTASTTFNSSANCYNRVLMGVNGATPTEVGFSGTSATGACYVGTSFEFTVYLANGSYVDIFNYPNLASSVPYNIGMLEVQRVDKTAVSAGGGYTKWQEKVRSTVFNTTGVIPELTFNNLEIGKTYRIGGDVRLDAQNTSSASKTLILQILNGATVLRLLSLASYSSTGGNGSMVTEFINKTFVATSTTLTFNVSTNTLSQVSDATISLEELPQHIQTNQWT